MNRKIYITVLSVLSLLVPAVFTGCMEHAFPNDALDKYWRLETKTKGGQTNQVDSIIMFGFERHIVLIESPGFTRHGITTDTGDSLKLDFSMYPDTAVVLSGLNAVGIDSTVVTFGVKYPKDRLILSNDQVVLKFIKW